MLFICLALIIALLPVLIMRKVKESRESQQKEDFYNNCRRLRVGMDKNEVISLLGNDYRFNRDLHTESYCWVKKFNEKEHSCVVTFKDECIVQIEMK